VVEPRILIQEDWIIAVFLLILVLFTIVKLQEPKRLQMLYKMFSIRGSQIDFFAFDSNLLNWFNIILSSVFFMGLGLLLYRVSDFHSVVPFENINGFVWFAIIVGSLVLYSLIRKLFGYFIGLVVESQVLVKRYFLMKQLYAQWVGLFLIPFLLLEFYSPFSSLNFSYFVVSLYVLLQLVSYLRIAYVFVFEASVSSYHLFVYICALEILPFLVLVRLTLNSLNGM
jgi:hypothetical protein